MNARSPFPNATMPDVNVLDTICKGMNVERNETRTYVDGYLASWPFMAVPDVLQLLMLCINTNYARHVTSWGTYSEYAALSRTTQITSI